MLMLNKYRNKKQAEALLLNRPILDSNLVFGNLENEPLLPDTISHAWGKLIKRLGLRYIRLHDARHNHASIFLKRGIHPKIVQERLGHATISTTLDIYSHVAPGLQQQAAKQFDDALQIKHNRAVENSR